MFPRSVLHCALAALVALNSIALFLFSSLSLSCRLSIYGRSPSEWSKLAAWVVDNGLASKQVGARSNHIYCSWLSKVAV